MTQLLIGRTVEGREMRMHSLLVDWPPGCKDARWRGGLWLCVGLPHVNTLCFVLCVVLTGAGLEFTTRA